MFEGVRSVSGVPTVDAPEWIIQTRERYCPRYCV